jgi:hypothetical protein
MKECAERGIAPPQMIHPNRRINQHGQLRAGGCAGGGLDADLARCPLKPLTVWRFPWRSRLRVQHERPQSSRQCY